MLKSFRHAFVTIYTWRIIDIENIFPYIQYCNENNNNIQSSRVAFFVGKYAVGFHLKIINKTLNCFVLPLLYIFAMVLESNQFSKLDRLFSDFPFLFRILSYLWHDEYFLLHIDVDMFTESKMVAGKNIFFSNIRFKFCWMKRKRLFSSLALFSSFFKFLD